MLLFKKKFLPAIRSGQKTQTIRLWKHRRLRSGQRSYIPGAGYIDILHIDEVSIADLTDEDARPDGFETAAALRAELDALYQDELASGYRAYRVCFIISADQTKRESTRTRRRATSKKAPATDPQTKSASDHSVGG